MEISDSGQLSGNAFTVASQASNESLGAEFDTFLTLLTAQIRNQDPLAPLDSTQFVEQLATFTGLEQQVQGNQFLENISNSMIELMSLAASEWVGQTVEVESAFVPFEGDEVSFTADIPARADQATLQILNSAGEIIETQALDTSDTAFAWNGTTASGAPADQGLYQMKIDLFEDGNFLGSVAPRLISQVTEASLENGKIRLGLENRLSEFAENVRKAE